MTTTTDRPAQTAGGLYFPTDVSPEQAFQALGRLRKEAMDEIERLLSFLDAIGDCDEDSAADDNPCDGDPDAEPTLGWTDAEAKFGKRYVCPEGEDEPVLGSVVATDQTRWASGNQDDREGDGCADDREGDELEHGGEAALEDDERGGDEEPSLGWPINGSMNPALACQDLEQGEPARPPQNRTVIDQPALRVEHNCDKIIHGLTDSQRRSVRERMLPDSKVRMR